MKTYRQKLLVGVSILAIGGFSLPPTAQAGTCTRSVKCLDYKGQAVADSYCTNKVGAKPSTSKSCACENNNYSNSSGSSSSGGSSSGNDGGGYEDTNGDNRGDTRSQSRSGHHATTDRTASSGSSGGSSGGRVICTYFYLNGEISKDYYYADFEYTLTRIHPNTVKGYHFWAVPYVEKLYQQSNTWLEKIIRPVAINRAEELAYQMGVRAKPNYLGKFFRALIEPVCFVIGAFVKETDYTRLYTKEYLERAARQYSQYRVEQDAKKQRLIGTPLSSFTI